MMKLLAPLLLPALAAALAFTGTTSLAPAEAYLHGDPVREYFRSECASCHGNDGRGQTRAGRRAGVKDFTDRAYQDSWTDDEAVEVIRTATKNGEELRNKNPYADELSEAEIRALVRYVRSFVE